MRPLRIILLAAGLLASIPAPAQTTYRWTDKATGQTVFSDRPPPSNVAATVQEETTGHAGEGELPFALRTAASKYPVTLYTADNCLDACRQARELLAGRGIPFSERALKTEGDFAEARNRLGPETPVPSLSVGQQLAKGFDAPSWNGLLDLAGYPRTAPYGARILPATAP